MVWNLNDEKNIGTNVQYAVRMSGGSRMEHEFSISVPTPAMYLEAILDHEFLVL